jgi:hypothetical protein
MDISISFPTLNIWGKKDQEVYAISQLSSSSVGDCILNRPTENAATMYPPVDKA